MIPNLNEEQRQAVYSQARHILVAAPPGSGKTACLAARFGRLAAEGVRPEELLAITFTNRAAREMKGRVAATIGLKEQSLNIGTFHAFCLRVLKETRPGFRLYGRQDSERVLKDIGVKNPGRAADKISALKNALIPPGADALTVLDAYRKKLFDADALDLDDLVIEAAAALGSGAAQKRFGHVLVDEYQDINPRQSALIKCLVKDGASLFAIGDPDQAIYGFRGADARGFLEFERDFPGCAVIRLKRNYRSAGNIVKAAGALIRGNADRVENETLPTRGNGVILRAEAADGRAEAGFIIKEIESAMGGLTSLTVKDAGNNRFSDFAVLFRTKRQAHALIEAFDGSAIPHHYVTLPGATIAEFIAYISSHEHPPDADISGYIEAQARLLKIPKPVFEILMQAAWPYKGARISESFAQYLEDLKLLDGPDTYDIEADKVSLMTIHASKGLEFKYVFIAGVEDGLIPLRMKDKDFDIEEERRLLYVGMTRAKDALYLLSARTRTLCGVESGQSTSLFLSELPTELVPAAIIEKKKTRRRAIQKGLFE
ncbi:MAG: UvrD-helicase domain-containing protein [Deltaproteobacteria bacterium]|nr:UvrD-helicase domain-containing protein [Deltaproteobacteria bacterium]